LGVLDAVERFQIPIINIVGSGWGAWVAAVWGEGFSVAQIRNILTQSESFSAKAPKTLGAPHFPVLWDAVSAQGFPAFSVEFSLNPDSSGIPLPGPVPPQRSKGRGFAIVSQLLLQQPLLDLTASQTRPPRLPWSVLLCDQERAQGVASPSRPPVDWVFSSLGFSDLEQQSKKRAPLSECGILPTETLIMAWPDQSWILSLSWPVRPDGSTSAVLRRELESLALDSSFFKIWVRPHALPQNPSSPNWEKLGFESLRSKLGEFKTLKLTPRSWKLKQERPIPSLETVQPAFDNISAEYQNHLSSYWPKAERWQGDVQGFADELAQGGLYDSLSMVLVSQKTTDLEDGRELLVPVIAVHAAPLSRFETALGGYGSTLMGPIAAGRLRFRFVNQFEYDFALMGFFGESSKGIRPAVSLSRIYGGDLSFHGQAEIAHYNWNHLYENLAPRTVRDDWSKMVSEQKRDVTLQVRWILNPLWEMRPTVAIGQSRLETALSEQLNADKTRTGVDALVNSMSARLEWERVQGVAGERFFADPGVHHQGELGVQAIGLQTFGKSSAPLFGRLHLAVDGVAKLSSAIRLGVFSSAGIDGRFRSDGQWRYPDSLELIPGLVSDPAINDRYKMHFASTPFASQMILPQQSSAHFFSLGSSLGIQKHGNGLWIFAAYAHDFEGGDVWNRLDRDRLTLEPLARLKWKSAEILAGGMRMLNLDEASTVFEATGWTWILQVGLSRF
jgi:NTE family protein